MISTLGQSGGQNQGGKKVGGLNPNAPSSKPKSEELNPKSGQQSQVTLPANGVSPTAPRQTDTYNAENKSLEVTNSKLTRKQRQQRQRENQAKKPQREEAKPISLADFQGVKDTQSHHTQVSEQNHQYLKTLSKRHQTAYMKAQIEKPHAGEVGTNYNPVAVIGHSPSLPCTASVKEAVSATRAAQSMGLKVSDHAEARMMQDYSGKSTAKVMSDVIQSDSSNCSIFFDPRSRTDPKVAPIMITRQDSTGPQRNVAVCFDKNTMRTTMAGIGQLNHFQSIPIGNNAPEIKDKYGFELFEASRQQIAQKVQQEAKKLGS